MPTRASAVHPRVAPCFVEHAVQSDGALDLCEVATEFPLDGGYGRAALAAMPEARVISPNETPGQYAPRLIGFRVHYRQ